MISKTPGWSGGQYSLARVVFGLGLIGLFLVELAALDRSGTGHVPLFPNLLVAMDPPLSIVPGALAVASGLLLAWGWHDRIAALALLYLWLCLWERQPVAASAAFFFVGVLLVAHLFVPAGPYGSWTARSRIDPGAGWRMPPWIHRGLWLCLALGYGYQGVVRLQAQAFPFELLVLPLALWRGSRPWLWVVLVVAELVTLPFAESLHSALGVLFMLLFTFDPAWVAPRGPEGREMLFYDGHCGLCHGWVRFLLAEDEAGRAFRFAPLQSAAFLDVVSEEQRVELPDSLVLRRTDGSLLVRSAAIRHILKRLGGIWAVTGLVSGIVPAWVRDSAYSAVAAVRHRLFARPDESCPIVPQHLRGRLE